MRALLVLSAVVLAAATLAGKYEGKWNSTNGSQTGPLHVVLSEDNGQWKGEAGFGLDGNEVPCKITKLEVSGSKLVLAYQFELGGYNLISTLTGELSGNVLAGRYETKPVDGSVQVDAGDWKIARE